LNKDCLTFVKNAQGLVKQRLNRINEKIWLNAGTSENPVVLVDKRNFIVSKNLSGADNQQERLELEKLINFRVITYL
jgi:hypothetical protein